jgi:alpha-L-fucosidase
MKWWKEARFGMFIHWGLYAIPAGTWNGKQVSGIGEWIMNKGKIPVADYQKLPGQFNPVKFDAEQWVKMAKDAGVKYIVITSKHHDGFAMFKSDASSYNIVDATPFKRDVVAEMAAACKKYGIKLGLYYSQAQDWGHPGGAAIGGNWDSAQNGNMDKYLDEIAVPQVKEILTKYGPIAVLWWDTPTGMTKERAAKFKPLLQLQPYLITNNRLGGGEPGDLETPEQYIPATGIPGKFWESCMTMNNTWGFKSYDTSWKSSETLIRNLIDIASKGGNYLLNVGPTAEGLIPQASVERLKAMGEWLHKNGEAIYGTTASPFAYLNWGRCTQKGNKLFLHIFKWPSTGKLKIPLNNEIEKAYILTDPLKKVGFTKDINGTMIDLPLTKVDTIATVVVLELRSSNISVANTVASYDKIYTSSSEQATKRAEMAFDGNPSTSWKAADEEKTGWVSVDLGKPEKIGAIALEEAGDFDKFIQKYKVEYKQGEDWKTLFEGKTIGAAYLKSFLPVTAQVFRIFILESKKTPELKDVKLFLEIE